MDVKQGRWGGSGGSSGARRGRGIDAGQNNGLVAAAAPAGSDHSERRGQAGVSVSPSMAASPSIAATASLQTDPAAAGGASVAVASGAAAAVADFGVTGAGVKVGIISDSFDASGLASAAETSGALPNAADVQVLADSASGNDEGLAMAEIAHDVAPGAEIAFADAGGSVTTFAAAIASLAATGCNIICDDVSYGNEPFYQTGDAAEAAISTFTAAGGIYFTAASNAGPHSSYEASWKGMTATLPEIGTVTAMNFGTATAAQASETLTLKAGRATTLDLQWAQPWASLDGRGSAYSLALAIYDPSGKLVKTIADSDVGGDPLQWDSFTPTVSGAYTVAVYANGGATPGGLFKIVANNDATDAAAFAASSGSGSIYGHEMDPQAITVGAVDAADTPAYGAKPKSERFNAAGPGLELFSGSGAPLAAPRALNAVDISGPDGQGTTLPESDLNPFYGTSAATPAVAAVGALMLQANPSLDSGEIKGLLQESALAFGSADQAGAGLVQAQGAVALAEESNTAIHDNFFATGQSALLWQNGEGGAEISQVSSDALLGTTTIPGPSGPGWDAVASGDFSGAAGHGDVLWQNRDGRLSISHMDGGATAAQAAIAADPGQGWKVVGTGDFNGDGQSDILMRDAAGAIDIWLMDGGRVASQAVLQGPGAGWTAEAVGDFNGDGKSDVVWQDANGALALWMMDGVSVASELTIPSNPGSDWHVAGTGDFSGDGAADILLRDAVTGALDIWAVNGTGVASQTALSDAPGAGWQVAGVGQFGANGHDGILFDDATGGTMLAEVRHGQIATSATAAGPGSGWAASVA